MVAAAFRKKYRAVWGLESSDSLSFILFWGAQRLAPVYIVGKWLS